MFLTTFSRVAERKINRLFCESVDDHMEISAPCSTGFDRKYINPLIKPRGKYDERQSRQPGPADASKISLSQKHEVAYWTKTLGITADELTKVVGLVGNSAAKVRDHLASKVSGKRS